MTRYVFPNGLSVLLESSSAAQSVAAGYFISAGASDERRSEMGVSHFLEHLMFKGSETLSAQAINERLDDLGGYSNAFTSEEATVYYAAALPERVQELLETLTHLMRPALRPADIEPERQVILEEIAMYAEQPSVRVMDTLRSDYWGPHPLGHQVLGTVETVSRLSRDALQRNYRERYGADRVMLAVVGAFDEAKVLAWAKRELASWPLGEVQPVPGPSVVGPAIPAHPGTLRRLVDPELNRAQVALAAPGLSARHPLREAAAVLADLIGGENGALYWALVDTGLSDTADLAHLDYRGVGVFEGGFSCDPGRLEAAQSAYRQVLSSAESLITETAVRRAAQKAAVSTLLQAEASQGRLFALGMEYLAVGEVRTTEQLAGRFTAVTAEQVREVLRLCPLHSLTGVVLGPA